MKVSLSLWLVSETETWEGPMFGLISREEVFGSWDDER